MAEIVIRNTNERITGDENVRNFLDKYEVLYEKWDASKLSAELQNNFGLTDDQKTRFWKPLIMKSKTLLHVADIKSGMSSPSPNKRQISKKNWPSSRKSTPMPKMKSVLLLPVKGSLLSKEQMM